MTLVFVYGTLLRGESNHGLMRGATFVGAAATVPGFALLNFGAHPGIVRDGAGIVHGELYDVSAEQLAALDRFEDHPRFYRREGVRLADGREAQAYLPVEPDRGVPRVMSGDWRTR